MTVINNTIATQKTQVQTPAVQPAELDVQKDTVTLHEIVENIENTDAISHTVSIIGEEDFTVGLNSKLVFSDYEKRSLVEKLDLDPEVPVYILTEIGERLLKGEKKENLKVWKIETNYYGDLVDHYAISNSVLDVLIELKAGNPGMVIGTYERIHLVDKVKTVYDFSFVVAQADYPSMADLAVSEIE